MAILARALLALLLASIVPATRLAVAATTPYDPLGKKDSKKADEQDERRKPEPRDKDDGDDEAEDDEAEDEGEDNEDDGKEGEGTGPGAPDTTCGGCDDDVACTADRCVDGRCEHTPRDRRCDRGDCAVAVCRPSNPDADESGCVTTRAREGDGCTDDGVPCTEDRCSAGVCLHVPIDARCEGGDACGVSRCAPPRGQRDATGCVTRGQGHDGDRCADDGDLCTDDRCAAGQCAHEAVSARAACDDLTHAFRTTIGLRTLAADLSEVARRGPSLATRLLQIETDLDRAAQALQGDGPTTAVAQAAGATSQMLDPRARIAFEQVLRTPRAVQHFLTMMRVARVRTQLGKARVRTLTARGRALLRGTKALRRHLRRLARPG